MPRNRWFVALASLAFVATLTLMGAAMRPTASASPAAQLETPTATISETATFTPTETLVPTETVTPTATPFDITPTTTATATPGGAATRRFWSYTAAFSCGDQSSPISGTLGLAPGRYATTISIHNPYYRGQLSVYRQALLLVSGGQAVGRAPAQAQAQVFSGPVNLSDGSATLEDCASIWALANPGVTPPAPMPLMTGYLAIVSPRELDVVSTLTSAPADDAQTLGAPAVSMLSVPGKRATLPASALPGGVFPPDDQFVEDAQPAQ